MIDLFLEMSRHFVNPAPLEINMGNIFFWNVGGKFFKKLGCHSQRKGPALAEMRRWSFFSLRAAVQPFAEAATPSGSLLSLAGFQTVRVGKMISLPISAASATPGPAFSSHINDEEVSAKAGIFIC